MLSYFYHIKKYNNNYRKGRKEAAEHQLNHIERKIIMNDYENNNNVNNTSDVSDGSGNYSSGAENNTSTGNSYTDYRSGYYRNTNPHQDEPIGQRNSYSGNYTGYTNKTGSENGYNYVNYYNTTPAVEPEKKKKGKKKLLKITACVTAIALVIGASFAGGYFMGGDDPDSPEKVPVAGSSETGEESSDESAETQQAVDTTVESQPSLIDLASREDAITVPEIVEKISPSVVGIQATYVVQTESSSPSDFGFGFGYYGWGNNNDTQSQEAVATGTGVIMSEDGYIITNAHVVYDTTSGYGLAKSVEIQMADGETIYPAEIVAYDVETDLAVLKVDQTGLTPAEFGNSDECQVGELVVAIGNPLGLELQNTVTCGIISALNREVTINDKEMTLIQTDTAINSGNSGGPLINSAGQVIGINSAKMSSSYSSNSATIEGIGFAIPITEAKEIIDDLITYGYVTGRPQLGITCQDVSETVSQAYNIPVGSYIISVTEGGAADKAGLQIQDVIIAIDGNTITTTEELNDYKNEHAAGEQVVLTVVRSGQTLDIPITLEEAVASAD